jgi:hypothetical protein
MEIDLFQGNFPIIPTNARPDELIGEPSGTPEEWTDWTTEQILEDIAKITFFFVGFKNATDCIRYYRIVHNCRDVGPNN